MSPISPIRLPQTGGPSTAPAQRQGPAYTLGQQQYNLGSGLLGNAPLGNGWGADNGPTLGTSNPSNPWLRKQGQGIEQQTMDMLGQGLLGIQGNAVGTGGLGGTRQGIAQGTAMGQAANFMSSNLADMYGDAWNQQQNRNLGKYQMDTNFYNAQRGQDLASIGLGSGLINQGLSTQWQPLTTAADIYSKFTNNGTQTTTSQQGGGLMGAIGGGLGMLNFGQQQGWWGKPQSSGKTDWSWTGSNTPNVF